jgi:hypothetical protein
MGSIAVLNAIPIIGPIVGFFYVIYVQINGLKMVHDTTGAKATFAVLFPMFGIIGCCCVLGMILVLPALAQVMGQMPR